jgi:hypothetical protein
MQSTTPTSQRSQYLSDILSKKLALAVTLVNAPASFTLPTGLAFSPAWLVSHMQFNSGAVLTIDSPLYGPRTTTPAARYVGDCAFARRSCQPPADI